MTTATATNLDGSEPDEVMVAEELAAAAKQAGEEDTFEVASAAVDDHNTIATDTAPTIDTIRAGIRSLLIAWDGVEAVHGHGYYEAQIDTDVNFGTPDDFYKGKATFTVFDGLTTGVTYYARVRAVDAAGNTGPWSSTTGGDTSDPTGTGDIDDGAVTTVKIDDLAVTNAKIGSLAVDTAKIASAAITTAKIDNLAVTTAKIANADITTAKIANLAVTEAKIGNLAVDTAKIKDLAVETLKIADLNVTIDKEASPVLAESGHDSASGATSPTSATAVSSVTVTAPSWAGSTTITATHVGQTSQATADGIFNVNVQIAGANSNFNDVGYVSSASNNLDRTISGDTYSRDVSIPGSSTTVNGRLFNTESSANYFSTLSTVSIHTR